LLPGFLSFPLFLTQRYVSPGKLTYQMNAREKSQASCFQGEKSHVTRSQSIQSPQINEQITTTSQHFARNVSSLSRPLAHSRAASPSAV
jgi:hypothetical protein